ncbi:unnamed protein product [Parajaminaea phylloscopi]
MDLPEVLQELKRPALVQLCKERGVKASGKNQDLVRKLRASYIGVASPVEQTVGHDVQCTGSETGPGEGSAPPNLLEETPSTLLPDEHPSEHMKAELAGRYSEEAGQQAMPGAYEQPQAQRGHKRDRSPSAPRDTQAAQPVSCPSDTPAKLATRRSVAPLPRNSMASAIYPPLPTWGSPQTVRSPLAPLNSSAGSQATAGVDAQEPAAAKFTFQLNCLSAQRSVVEKLNERLAASGQGQLSEVGAAKRRSGAACSTRVSLKKQSTKEGDRYFKAHGRVLTEGPSIASHWSVRRRLAALGAETADRDDAAASSKRRRRSTDVDVHSIATPVRRPARPATDALPSSPSQRNLVKGVASAGQPGSEISAWRSKSLAPSTSPAKSLTAIQSQSRLRTPLAQSSSNGWRGKSAAKAAPAAAVSRRSKLRSSLGAASKPKAFLCGRKPTALAHRDSRMMPSRTVSDLRSLEQSGRGLPSESKAGPADATVPARAPTDQSGCFPRSLAHADDQPKGPSSASLAATAPRRPLQGLSAFKVPIRRPSYGSFIPKLSAVQSSARRVLEVKRLAAAQSRQRVRQARCDPVQMNRRVGSQDAVPRLAMAKA